MYDKVRLLGLGAGAEEILNTGVITLNEDGHPLGEWEIKMFRQLKQRADIPILSLQDVAKMT